jgi:hypothetical protein
LYNSIVQDQLVAKLNRTVWKRSEPLTVRLFHTIAPPDQSEGRTVKDAILRILCGQRDCIAILKARPPASGQRGQIVRHSPHIIDQL